MKHSKRLLNALIFEQIELENKHQCISLMQTAQDSTESNENARYFSKCDKVSKKHFPGGLFSANTGI